MSDTENLQQHENRFADGIVALSHKLNLVRQKIAELAGIVLDVDDVPQDIVDDWIDWLLETYDPPCTTTPVIMETTTESTQAQITREQTKVALSLMKRILPKRNLNDEIQISVQLIGTDQATMVGLKQNKLIWVIFPDGFMVTNDVTDADREWARKWWMSHGYEEEVEDNAT